MRKLKGKVSVRKSRQKGYCANFRYNFRLLDTSGWNFRHAHYHEEGRRTLYKAYGIKFVIIVQGRAGAGAVANRARIERGDGLLSGRWIQVEVAC